MEDKPLVNRVANSGLITLNLEDYYPNAELVTFDLKDYLYMELILKEKDFRAALKEIDWSVYEDKILLVFCSSDAIIPVWAYMLVASCAAPYAKDVFAGEQETYLRAHYKQMLHTIDPNAYADQRVVIKGCSEKPVPAAAYLELTRLLRPHVKSLMYGEPCSTVPIYKKRRQPPA